MYVSNTVSSLKGKGARALAVSRNKHGGVSSLAPLQPFPIVSPASLLFLPQLLLPPPVVFTTQFAPPAPAAPPRGLIAPPARAAQALQRENPFSFFLAGLGVTYAFQNHNIMRRSRHATLILWGLLTGRHVWY